MRMMKAHFRFNEELHDFLPAAAGGACEYSFLVAPAIKDAIESLGVPHPEVDLILVNGRSVGWDYRLAHGDEVSVYPRSQGVHVSPVLRLRSELPLVLRFVLDAHLGRLARLLRMLGFDSTYDSRADRKRIVEIAAAEQRLILTRDRGLLKDGRVTLGYWVRTTQPRLQIEEVIRRFGLRTRFTPFARCMQCNGILVERAAAEVAHQVPPRVRNRAPAFKQCSACEKIYWEGTHVERMRRLIAKLAVEPWDGSHGDLRPSPDD